jgi:hypothetical protein
MAIPVPPAVQGREGDIERQPEEDHQARQEPRGCLWPPEGRILAMAVEVGRVGPLRFPVAMTRHEITPKGPLCAACAWT